MFDGNRSNQSSPYYSGGKRRRDSLLTTDMSSLQPYLMGTSSGRSPTQKRTRLSLGGSGNTAQDVDWSSFLNFQTSVRPGRQRSSNLRRRETIHSLPGQPAPLSFSSNSLRGGVMNASPGFFVRDRNERQSVARALQILESRKRLPENSTSKPPDGVSDEHVQYSTSVNDKVNKKRRRLTINGRIEDILQQGQSFASTSLGEITGKRTSHVLREGESRSFIQKRMFTSTVLGASEPQGEPSSKRQRPGDSTSGASLTAYSTDVKKTEDTVALGSSAVQNHSQSEAAQRRRLLSYMAPAQVEARYARQSAATELLARSRNSSRSSTPSVSRRTSQTPSALATTGAQTELSCGQKEKLEKSPDKDDDQQNEISDETSTRRSISERRRRCQLSVKDFVAHLDRARASPQTQQPSDALRRSAVDNAARRDRLNRLRKLLSDVTKEPNPPVTSVSNILPSGPLTSSVLNTAASNTLPTATTIPKKNLSFGFGEQTLLGGTTRTESPPIVSVQASGQGKIAFGLSPKTTSVSSLISTSNPSVTSPSFAVPPINSSSASGIVPVISVSAPNSSSASITNAAALNSTPSSLPTTLSISTSSVTLPTVTSTSFGFGTPVVSSAATVATNSFNFGQSGKGPANTSSTQNLITTFGQVPTMTKTTTSTSQPSVGFAIGALSKAGSEKAVTATVSSGVASFGESAGARLSTSNSLPTPASTGVANTASVFSFGNQSSEASAKAFSFGDPKKGATSVTATGQSSKGQLPFELPKGPSGPAPGFSFGESSVKAPPVFNPSPAPTSTTKTPFTFGNTSQPVTSIVTPTSSALVNNSGESKSVSQFTFGSSANAANTNVTAPTTKVGFSFGQVKNESTAPSGGMFSFNKSSTNSVSSSSATSLFSFGSTGASANVTKPAVGNGVKPATDPMKTISTGGFSFTNNQQNSSSGFKSNDANSTPSTGLFSFGQSKTNSTSSSGGLFGNVAKNGSASSSNAPFAFGAKAVTASVTHAPSTTSSKSFTFNVINGSDTVTTTASVAFGNTAKTPFTFGNTTTVASGNTTPAPVGAFSFGNSQQPKVPQQSVNPVNKTNGSAGFTFHPPPGNSVNQSGGFNFGGAPSIPLGQQSTPGPSPFAFGQQQSPAQPPAGNMFSQTATSAPRKKAGLARKRSTRK